MLSVATTTTATLETEKLVTLDEQLAALGVIVRATKNKTAITDKSRDQMLGMMKYLTHKDRVAVVHTLFEIAKTAIEGILGSKHLRSRSQTPKL